MAEYTFHRESSHSCPDSIDYTTTNHNGRPRHQSRTKTTYDQLLYIITLLLLVLAIPHTSATVIPTRSSTGSVLVSDAILTADTISIPEEIIFDHSPPPARVSLSKRADTPKKEYTGDTIISDTSQSPSDSLPSPFDTTLGNNFTSPQCLPFFQTFLSNATFSACLPFSLLLQTSSGFFQTIRQPARLTRTLDATCNVNVTDCSLLMSNLNTQLRSNSICGPDLSRQNPVVIQAANGFAAYDTLYRAACLKTRTTSLSPSHSSAASSASPTSTSSSAQTYCFAQAATNTSAPDSMYTYFLPMGMKLPQDAHPACTGCLRDTMAVFAQSAAVNGQGVAGTYADAARTVNAWCGAGFAREDVRVASSTGGADRRGRERWWMVVVLGVVAWVMV
ncbi:Hypothetical protein D9617_5g070590 [Elsinoe fawcettii]|nr:Hypothetical protein D9617_5g070590 [Elsinoe fawcettii]